jgi:hypothetical protein
MDADIVKNDMKKDPYPYRRLFMEFENDTFAEIVQHDFLDVMFNGSNYQEIQDNIRHFKMLDEPFKTLTSTIETFHRGYMSEVFEKFILEAHQHGIVEYFYRKIYNRFGKIKEDLETETKVLTMYMLSAGFYVWLGTVGIACIVFIGEHIKFAIDMKIESKKLMKIPISK